MGQTVHVRVFRKALSTYTISERDPHQKLWRNYEWHIGDKIVAAGLETIGEIIDDISATFRGHDRDSDDVIRDSDDVIVGSPKPTKPNLFSLTREERLDFVEQAPLLGYENDFLPH